MNMRKFKHRSNWWSQVLKNAPQGVCTLCGGAGKYKETFKHKNPIIHRCWRCEGTGEER